MIKEMYNNYKSEFNKKNSIFILIGVIFIIGLIFGSIYITILSNEQKEIVMNEVSSHFNSMNNINFTNKIDIFRNTILSNLIYVISMWLLGISIIGIPIIFIMIFFKSFILGMSVSSIFAKYGFKGIIKVTLHLIPSNLIFIIYIFILSMYSILISVKVLSSAFKKQNINFKLFMGKYIFILVIGILISTLCALYDAFLEPSIYKIVL